MSNKIKADTVDKRMEELVKQCEETKALILIAYQPICDKFMQLLQPIGDVPTKKGDGLLTSFDMEYLDAIKEDVLELAEIERKERNYICLCIDWKITLNKKEAKYWYNNEHRGERQFKEWYQQAIEYLSKKEQK